MSKTSNGAHVSNLRDEYDVRSRFTTCPFAFRDVPCYIDKHGNPNLDDYVWVQVRAIKDPKILEEWRKEFQLQDGFNRPTHKQIKDILHKITKTQGCSMVMPPQDGCILKMY